MQESFWWWQCSDRYIISLFPHLHTPFPTFSPSLTNLMVSVDVKHHVYLHWWANILPLQPSPVHALGQHSNVQVLPVTCHSFMHELQIIPVAWFLHLQFIRWRNISTCFSFPQLLDTMSFSSFFSVFFFFFFFFPFLSFSLWGFYSYSMHPSINNTLARWFNLFAWLYARHVHRTRGYWITT